MKRTIGILLLCAILLSTVACSGGTKVAETEQQTTPSNTESASETETEDPFDPHLPKMDFGGENFTFAHVSTADYAYKLAVDLVAEEQNAETINDAVYLRNTAVEDTCNIKIVAEYADGFGMVTKWIKEASAAGDDLYDAINERLYEIPQLITGGYLRNLYTLPYIDFTRDWWDQSSVESLTIRENLFLAASDIFLSDKYATACVMFNKDLAKDFAIEDPYTLVKEGKWTLDRIRTISADISYDVDGDGTMTEEDFYGILGRRDMTTFFFHGADGRIAQTDPDNGVVDVFYNEHNVSAVDQIFQILYDENIFFNVHTRVSLPDNDYYTFFRDGHTLFYVGCMMEEVSKLREADLNFGIIPNPKYDEAQKDYHSTVSVHHTGLLSVPKTAMQLEKIGYILEALSAKSAEVLQPAYYETALKGKALRDMESEEMLDIIFANRVFDLGDIMNFGNFSIDFICISTGSKSQDITSFYEKYKPKIAADIEKFMETLDTVVTE